MFDISLPDRSNSPLYLQLYTYFRAQIRSGKLPQGTRLPSVRSLCLQLNISKITIETAYQMLLADGYVASKPRSGYYACLPDLETAQAIPSAIPRKTVPSDRSSISVDFHPATIDSDAFPIQSWKSAIGEVFARHNDTLHRYGDPRGEYEFRTVLAQYLEHSRGVVCSPEQIVVGTGVNHGIQLLARLFDSRSKIAFEDPGYAPVRATFAANGFDIVPISIEDEGIRMAELERSDARMAYLTPSHQFPTGGTLPLSSRQRLLQWAYGRNAYLIEDDYDGEFRYADRPIPSLQGLDRQGAVIYIGTFSKVFTSAIRMNYMVLPAALARKLNEVEYALNPPSRIDQLAMKVFIEKGFWYRHIRRMRNLYRKKRLLFVKLIQEYLGDSVQIRGQNAGLHLEITVKCVCSKKQLIDLAAAEGVRVYGMEQMRMRRKPEDERKIYLGYGGVKIADMERGIRLLKQAWTDVLK